METARSIDPLPLSLSLPLSLQLLISDTLCIDYNTNIFFSLLASRFANKSALILYWRKTERVLSYDAIIDIYISKYLTRASTNFFIAMRERGAGCKLQSVNANSCV